MQKNIFGTAGIRSRIGQYPLNPDTLIKLGRAIAKFAIDKHGKYPRILLANDTRMSSDLMKALIKVGLLQFPVKIYDAQILPTPAAYYLVNKINSYNCGIVITASHNPHTDNGIKIVDQLSCELSEQDELFISKHMNTDCLDIDYENIGIEYHVKTTQNTYSQAIISKFKKNTFNNIKVVIDCANGAVSTLAPTIFGKLGIDTIAINTRPNGTNINNKCGSTNPKILQQTVKKYNANIGFAFDGDGDRVVAVTQNLEVKDGDELIALLATHPTYANEAKLVSTIVSNLGLELWLKKQNKKLIKSNVGEKNVVSTMREQDCLVGGEPSGHIIIKDFAHYSDGIFVALKILETASITNNIALQTFKKFPQVTTNIPIKEKKDLTKKPFVDIIKKYQNEIIPGRLIARYSGTENILRVLIEGENKDQITNVSKLVEKDLSSLLD